MMATPQEMSQEGPVKKSPFEDLTKEDLVVKCKNLLVIAQKAKQSKNEAQSEIESYKLQLEKCISEKRTFQENVQTLQELVDSLTEQKLNFITEIDSANNKIKSLSGKCHSYEEELHKIKADLIENDKTRIATQQQLSDYDSEIISLKRQNKRLTEENEQLITQLTELETKVTEFNNIGLQQRGQLQILEEKISKDEKSENECELIKNRVRELEAQLQSSGDNLAITALEDKLKELTVMYESEKKKKEKLNIKLKSYKDKILKCATCINQLKNSRFILTKTVKEYSENIPKWQNDIIKASKILDQQLNELNKENLSLNEMINKLNHELETIKSNTAAVSEAQLATTEAQLLNLQKEFDTLLDNYDSLRNDYSNVKSEYNQLKTALPKIEQENKTLRKKIKQQEERTQVDDVEKLSLQLKAFESEKAMLVREKQNAKDNVSELENQNKLLTDQINKLRSEIEDLKNNINHITQIQSNENVSELNNLKSQVVELSHIQEEYNLLKKEHENIQDLNILLKEEVETLKLSLEQPRDDMENMSEINASLQADIVKVETKLAAYKQENASLLADMKETRARCKEFDRIMAEYEEANSKLSSYKTENAELLNEMKEVNQVLKERGEAISKLQKMVSEMEQLIEALEKERDNNNEEKNDLIKKITSLESALKNVEQNNFVKDATNQLVTERDQAIKLNAEKDAIISSLNEEIERIKQQQSSDLPNEDMSTSTISKAEEQNRMRDLDDTFEEKYTKLRIFALKLKKKLNETANQLENAEKDKAKLEKIISEFGAQTVGTDQVDGQISKQTTEVDEHVKIQQSKAGEADKMAEEIQKLKAELTTKSQQITSEKEAHKATKESLDKALRDVKKKSVLSLEMEDYERSMKELTAKMEDNKKKIIQMESTIDTQESTITTMKTQIKLLEEQIKSEETQNRLLKEDLKHAVEEAKENHNTITLKNEVIAKLEQDVELEKRKNEESDLELATVTGEKEKIIMRLNEEKAELNNKLKRIEFKCAELNETLRITNIELADLKAEYTSYKVRAQSVLRQNQTVDHSQEEQLKEEVAALKTHIEAITVKLNAANAKCSEVSAELESSMRHVSESGTEASRAQQRALRLQADLTRLSQQLDSERSHHALQISTLTQCYKAQISELETKLQETESLKRQLAAAQEIANSNKSSMNEDNNRNQYMLPVIPKDDVSDGEMDINVSMIPREEGEGSEAAPSPPLSKSFLSGGGNRSPVPLERLLEEGVPEDEALDVSALGLTPDQEIADLRRKLQAQFQRVKHVTVLLSESERECARMSQLSELLKSELRRARGTSGNTHNTEYMKNVTLKFLTLPPGDERSRLVPVLQKILTLTADETHKIQAVAKGQDPNPGRGWGSYLPWPGGK